MLIRRDGWVINHKKTNRLYKAEGLQLKPRRPRRRRAVLQRAGGTLVARPNERWAMDLMHDTLASGSTLRIFTVVDVCTRECVALIAEPQFRGTDVVARLSAAGDARGGLLAVVQCDNGLHALSRGAEARDVLPARASAPSVWSITVLDRIFRVEQ